MENVVDRSVKRFLHLLLIVDITLIVMHLVQLVMPLDSGHYLSIANDKSLGEAYRHIKLFWVLVLLIFLMYRRAAPLFFVWFMYFAGVLFLDVFEYHGAWGHSLMSLADTYSSRLPVQIPESMKGELGEVLLAAIVAVVMLLLIAIGYLNADADTRRMTRRLIVLSAAYAVFAVGVDYLYSLLPQGPVAVALGVIEEAGQLVVLSLILFYLYRHEVWHSNAG